MQQSDESLLEEIRNGSQAAMEVLVKKHYRTIFAYTYRKVGDYHLAYDMTQEIFIKMLKYISSYSGQGKFQHWLLKIAVNHCRDYYRSSAYRNKNQINEINDHLKDERENIEDLLSKKHTSVKVKEAIDQLPVYQREAIILKYYQDLKIKKIAELTEAKESTVKSRLKQGMAKLKIILMEGNEDKDEQIQPNRRNRYR
ncbi:RNA polymerase sigma-70 factor (ECF subfamily) [Natronobacillus azotifigens]|uniref:Sigma-70 family RNA polymerase sigma factor n=1 Tax=Natronobacillus azotifigens TaxID=472978 RepID=A0A9J6RE15_9BACI|nr:sigma-70 family RNA polymerase sigma factor [Natronobacillus azotifigens]MCZ0703709.1 sigma-70 family RNA polymerase sigma factor [Natronobacillus azotifigens]